MTPGRLFERAIALRGLLREQQDEADERGAYSPEMHEAFMKAGFYRVTQPRLFGGYEFELGIAYRLIVEISRGHPGAGWCLSLGGSHAYVVGSHWPERAQRELFGPDGHFIAPHRPAPTGTLKPADGGYILNGQWDYCSGITYATHLLCGAMLDGEGARVRSWCLGRRSTCSMIGVATAPWACVRAVPSQSCRLRCNVCCNCHPAP
jgi:3-hydroxy-9,10-secoandrosta-1,3,5(10)-triene-9,17-dione monooxygenase